MAQPTGSVVLQFRCLGAFAFLAADGWTIAPARVGVRSFLQFLAIHARAAISRSALIDALWPDIAPDDCSHRLHLAASGARVALREATAPVNPIVYHDDSYSWNPAVRITSDAERFARCYRDGSIPAMIEGIRLYNGEFLAGESADWLLPFRTRYEHMYITMLERLARDAVARHDYAAGTDFALEAVSADPAHEGAARLIMLCLAKTGRRTMALAEYDNLEKYLRRWLSVVPTAQTKALRDQIRRDEMPDTVA